MYSVVFDVKTKENGRKQHKVNGRQPRGGGGGGVGDNIIFVLWISSTVVFVVLYSS